jgi:CRISPR-associated protein Cas2
MVTYDVVDDKRRRKIAGELENFGERVQWSVFECYLDAGHQVDLKERLANLIDPEVDRVAYYVLCSRDQEQILCEGPQGKTKDWDYRIL